MSIFSQFRREFFCLPWSLAAVLLCCGTALAREPLQLRPDDRILVLAPHPDDETIGTAGVLQSAVALNIPVQVVGFTNGDSNGLSFLVYKKHPVLGQKGLVRMGELRHKETLTAMKLLGLSESQVEFLGYPDFGTLKMFIRHWGESARPFKSFMTRASAVPYKKALSPQAPYVGESVVRDLKHVLQELRPTRIFVSHPADHNVDHQACYLFLQVALWDLETTLPRPEIYPYLVHYAGWPSPKGFRANKPLSPPRRLKDAGIDWQEFPLTPQQVQLKKKAIDKYQSQTRYYPPYLYSFARKNELFGDFPIIDLRHQETALIDSASAVAGDAGVGDHVAQPAGRKNTPALAYSYIDGQLNVRVRPGRWIAKLLDVNVYLLGYNPGVPFAEMPKLRVRIKGGKTLTVSDKFRPVSGQGIHFSREGRELIVQVPGAVLENPKYVLSRVVVRWAGVALEMTPWRILELE